mmetsp:Transcript_7970/g.29696  ORF Transcript_7970/g.29696 Transcript_7970/m.29696 type:complete len:239 (-) Transcript_7970:1813-2529(-)
MKRTFESAFSTPPHHNQCVQRGAISPSNHMQIHPISHEDFSFGNCYPSATTHHHRDQSCFSNGPQFNTLSSEEASSFNHHHHPDYVPHFQPNKRICIRADSFHPNISESHTTTSKQFSSSLLHGGWNMSDSRHQTHYNILKQTLDPHHSEEHCHPSAQYIDIVVQCMNGRKIDVMIDPTCIVESLKSIIMRRLHLEPRQQRLVFKGKLCPDDNRLMDLGITDKAHLHLILQLRGGSGQ